MTEWLGVIIAAFALVISFIVPTLISKKEHKENIKLQLFEKRINLFEEIISIDTITNRLKNELQNMDLMEFYEISPSTIFFQIYTDDYLDYQLICSQEQKEMNLIRDVLYNKKIQCSKLKIQCGFLLLKEDAEKFISLLDSYIKFLYSLSEAYRIYTSSRENNYEIPGTSKEKIFKNNVCQPINVLIKTSHELCNKIDEINIDKIINSYKL